MYEEDEDDIVGRVVRARRGVSRALSHRSAAPRSIARANSAKAYYNAPGAGPGAEFPLGFGSVQFVNAGTTTAVLEADPQRLCKPSRLTVAVAREGAGATALIQIDDIKIGTQSQLISGEGLPADMFLPDAVGNTMKLAKCGPGVKCYIHISLQGAALGVGETIDVGAALLCEVLD